MAATPLLKKLSLLTAAVFLLLTGLLAVLWFQTPQPRNPDFLTPPSPNAYDLLLAAAAPFEEKDPSKITNNVAAFLAEHQSAFDQVQAALRHPAEAPPRSYDPDSMSFRDFVAFRRLERALLLKARQAEAAERWTQAGDLYLTIVRLGQNVEHGPLINLMAGSAIELNGLSKFETVIPHLPPNALGELIPALRELNHSRIPFEEVVRRERYFMTVNAPNLFKLLQERFSPHFRRTIENSTERYRNTEAYMEIIAASMAARHYALENSQPPATLQDLVPKYLPSLPIDPYTRRPLLSIHTSTNTLIYSAGPNQHDDEAKKDDITPRHKDTLGYEMIVDALSRAVSEGL